MNTIFLISLLASLVSAQQNVLVNGNSQLPACAQSCTALQQANTACAGTGTPQAAWICFCQSSYLTGSLISTACTAACTDTTQNAQVATWYQSNCGSDFGASEHAADTASTTTTTAADPAAPAATTSSSSNSGSNSNSNAGTSSSSTSDPGFDPTTSSKGGDWWSNHYQWIVMVIVLAIGFPLLAWFGVWLKRRYERKQDQTKGGFNAGITERSAPMGGNEEKNISGTLTPVGPAAASGMVSGSGRNSPARTREAFMPYGYGYAKSESRLGSSHAVDRPKTPLAAGATPDGQDNGGLGPWPAESSSKGMSRRG